MKWNATYRYRNAGTSNVFVDGGQCFIVNANTEQLVDADWGKEKVLAYTMYVRDKRKINISWGTDIEVSMQDGQVFVCTVTGVDFTISRLYTFTITNSLPAMSSNGSVSFKTKSGGGIDPLTGYPTASTVSWKTALDCRYVKTSENLQAKELGEPVVLIKYTIYLSGKVAESEQLRLYDTGGGLLGEFSIISTEFIDTKGITKITV